MIPLIILGVVLLLIIIRTLIKIKIEIWQIMLFGAIAVLCTLQITPIDAFHSIDFDVIVLLFCMFIIGNALNDSGYLIDVAHRIFDKVKSTDMLLFVFILTVGIFSMIFTNDTIAIIGSILCFAICKDCDLNAKLFLLTLAVSITSLCILSPIGSPQNLLIASSAVFQNAFVEFFIYQIIPTTLSVVFIFLFIRLMLTKKQISFNSDSVCRIKDIKLYHISRISIILMLVLIILKIILNHFVPSFDFKFMYIAIAGALPIVLFSNERIKMIKEVDWRTLVFFCSMFILMKAVWDSQTMQDLITNLPSNANDTTTVYLIGLLISQLISNVPLVTLYLPLLETTGAGILSYFALLAGSTLAGNLTILGAASNVIVIQQGEREGIIISFWDFFKIGFPICFAQSVIYIIYFKLLSLFIA